MAELLLELFSEEIPARMQERAEDDLKRLVGEALKDAGLQWDEIAAYSTPRRLALQVTGLPTSTPDISEERRGPKADAPDKAIEGFLKSAGVTRDQCEEREEKKGTFLYAKIEKKGRPTPEILAEKIPEIIRTFSWPKSQRWGDGELKWVRPLQRILCLLDGDMVSFQIEGLGKIVVEDDLPEIDDWVIPMPLDSTNVTTGHRFYDVDGFIPSDFADYKAKLEKAYVLIDREDRRDRIKKAAEALAKKAKLELVPNDALLDEVTGLVEWPVPLIASFDKSFLDLPSEVLVSEMRHHQKYFALNDPKTGELANKFIVVANIEGADEAIIAGNERVLAARLSDARFFWDQDQKSKLEDNLPRLDDIVFHARLGSVGDRTRRIAALAAEIAKFVPSCDSGMAERAALLSKADLVSGMVGEFPDLQGVMGGYYAAAQGEHEDVATAIREHYAPQGPGDVCPTAPVSVAVALAEKLDTLVGFFGIEERPTGSKDPYALRRSALSIIRLITENDLRLPLQTIVMVAENAYLEQIIASGDKARAFTLRGDQLWDEIIAFIADRLKVQTRERGIRHDLIDAVFAASERAADETGFEEDIVRLLARVEALQAFLGTENGENLLSGYTRAVNIVRIEEKKDGKSYDHEVDPVRLILDEEKALFKALLAARKAADEAVAGERFEDAMAAIAELRSPIDAFFDKVTVNSDDLGLRSNRLKLLSQIRASLNAVADFSRIEGQ